MVLWAVLAVAVTIQSQTATDCPSAQTPYECAVAQVQHQDFAAAIDTLTQQVLSKTPSNLKALNLLGIALTSAGRAEDAAARFQQALTIDPTFLPARKNLAINEFARGKLTEAQRDFDQVLQRVPDDEVTHLHLAEIAFQRNQPAGALPHYEKAHTRIAQSRNPTWIVHYAACLLAPGAQNVPGQATDKARADAVALLGQLSGEDAASAFAADAMTATLAIHVAEELLKTSPLTNGQRAQIDSLVAQAYLKTDRLEEAYDALREATRLEPGAVDHYVDLAMICVDHQNFDLGLEIIDIGQQHRPDSSLLALTRGVLDAMKGSIEQASAAFEQASTIAPNDPVPYVAQAMIWMQTGQAAKAVEVLRAQTKLKVHEKDPVLFYALGVALLRAGAAPNDALGNEATSAFASAVRLNPEFPQARAELGKLLLKRGETDGAITHLEKAVAVDPETAAPAYALAQAYRKRGDLDRARDLLARVSTINTRERGDDPDHELKRVIIRIVRDEREQNEDACAEIGDRDGAIALLRQEIRSKPTLAEAHYNLGLHLWERFKASMGSKHPKDLDEAVDALTQAVRLNPDEPRAQSALGQLLVDKQELGPAIDHLRRAEILAPDNPEHAYNLGLALRLNGDLDAAERELRTALRLNPNHARARRSLGLILRQKDDLPAAATELRQSVSLLPADAQGHHLLGTVLLKQGDLPSAIDELRQAVRLDPTLVEAHAILAQALARSGRRDEALQEQTAIQQLNEQNAHEAQAELRRAIALDPAYERGIHRLCISTHPEP